MDVIFDIMFLVGVGVTSNFVYDIIKTYINKK